MIQAAQYDINAGSCYPLGKQNQQSWMYNDGTDGSGERIIVQYDGGQDGRCVIAPLLAS